MQKHTMFAADWRSISGSIHNVAGSTVKSSFCYRYSYRGSFERRKRSHDIAFRCFSGARPIASSHRSLGKNELDRGSGTELRTRHARWTLICIFTNLDHFFPSIFPKTWFNLLFPSLIGFKVKQNCRPAIFLPGVAFNGRSNRIC